MLKELQSPIRMKKKAVAKKEPPTQEHIDEAERMAKLLEEEEKVKEEREKAVPAAAKVCSRRAFSDPRRALWHGCEAVSQLHGLSVSCGDGARTTG